MYEYQWTAILRDKKVISQYNDQKEVNFKLVIEEEKKGNLDRLIIASTPDKRINRCAVDLETGDFFIQDLKIHPYGERRQEIKPYQYRVIYFRRTFWDMIVGKTTRVTETQIAYFALGWQITLDGVNVQRILFLDPRTSEVEIWSKK